MVKSLCLGLLLAFIAAPAFACAMLKHGDPKVGSTVTGPLDHVTLTFSGRIYPEKSMLTVTDETETVVSQGKAYGTDTTLAVKVNALAPGKYKVSWNTYCDCKSYTPGDYKFTVR